MGTHYVITHLVVVVVVVTMGRLMMGTWCVARSEATREALQTALDYACGAGADCAPLQPWGLCFLPNTIQAHTSYAFNSYYMRSFKAPGSCDFSETATIAKTDPSYGSYVYPPDPSTAGGTRTSPVSGTGSGQQQPPPLLTGGGGGAPLPNDTLHTPLTSKASSSLQSPASQHHIHYHILLHFLHTIITFLLTYKLLSLHNLLHHLHFGYIERFIIIIIMSSTPLELG